MKVKHLLAILAHVDPEVEVTLMPSSETTQLTVITYKDEVKFEARGLPAPHRWRTGEEAPRRIELYGGTPWWNPYDNGIHLYGVFQRRPDLDEELEFIRGLDSFST